jgi:hypothetical protein
MIKKFESVGNALIGMFVPKINAGACGAAYCAWWRDCYQCSHRPCAARCRSGCGCDHVVCGGVCG